MAKYSKISLFIAIELPHIALCQSLVMLSITRNLWPLPSLFKRGKTLTCAWAMKVLLLCWRASVTGSLGIAAGQSSAVRSSSIGLRIVCACSFVLHESMSPWIICWTYSSSAGNKDTYCRSFFMLSKTSKML